MLDVRSPELEGCGREGAGSDESDTPLEVWTEWMVELEKGEEWISLLLRFEDDFHLRSVARDKLSRAQQDGQLATRARSRTHLAVRHRKKKRQFEILHLQGCAGQRLLRHGRVGRRQRRNVNVVRGRGRLIYESECTSVVLCCSALAVVGCDWVQSGTWSSHRVISHPRGVHAHVKASVSQATSGSNMARTRCRWLRGGQEAIALDLTGTFYVGVRFIIGHSRLEPDDRSTRWRELSTRLSTDSRKHPHMHLSIYLSIYLSWWAGKE